MHISIFSCKWTDGFLPHSRYKSLSERKSRMVCDRVLWLLGIAQFGILVQKQGKLITSFLKNFLNKKKSTNHPHKRFVKRKPKRSDAGPTLSSKRPKFRRNINGTHF